MSWEQVTRLSRDPLVTIGAHTMNHFKLNRLKAEEVGREIKASKTEIEQKTGNAVRHFAYPYGSRDEVGRREFDIAKTCGFKTMTTVREGNIFAGHRDHLDCLPRIEVTGRLQDLTFIDMRLCGLLSLTRTGLRRVVTE